MFSFFSFAKGRFVAVLLAMVGLLSLSAVLPTPAQAGTLMQLLAARPAASSASNCGGQGCAIAYSQAQSKAYFGYNSKGSANYDHQVDIGVLAQAAALTKCYNSGATDCDVAVWVKNGYVSIAIDLGASWGVGWGATASAAENEALAGCEATGGSAQTCRLTTEYSSPNASLTTSGYPAWGRLASNKYVEAIAYAYQDLGEKIYENQCLKFVQLAFGWTGGGNWAYPNATYAWNGYTYLEGKKLITYPAYPTTTNPSGVGDLVWFGKAPYDSNGNPEGHVGIYLGGNNQFISATINGIAIYDIPYWNATQATYVGFSKAPPAWLK